MRHLRAIAILGLGCSGEIGEPPLPSEGTSEPGQAPARSPGARGTATSSTSTAPPVPEAAPGAGVPSRTACVTRGAGPSPLRRLTAFEYDNTVRDLLGDTSGPGQDFPPDVQEGLFDNMASQQTVPPLLADKYLGAAERLASQAVRDLPRLLGCDPSARGEAACARDFIARFGGRAYRRPLAPEEAARLAALHDGLRAASDFATAIRGVVQALLVSPTFLFRFEAGAGTGAVSGAAALGPYEAASRLSYLVWSSMPDDVLFVAAARGELATAEQRQAQARRMLADPRARAAAWTFFRQLLHLQHLETLEKSPTVYPQFTAGLRRSMGEESRRFVEHVLFEGDARLATLLAARDSFADGALLALYGVPAAKDAPFQKVSLASANRAGILTHAGLLAYNARTDQSSPSRRGELVRVRLLCQELKPPPGEVPPLPPPRAGLSTRERFAQHASDPVCAACHKLLDGLGFGLEGYDGIGRWRTTDDGRPVDTHGELVATDVDGPFQGALELADRLARSAQISDCLALQWFRWAHARRETDADACSIEQLQREVARAGGDLREAIVRLARTDSFNHFRPAE